ncbi:MAG: GAF domain-containing protein [Anaerolineae bacterium]|nr:GAF domain-containing protein [Anaerolineae bacterium]
MGKRFVVGLMVVVSVLAGSVMAATVAAATVAGVEAHPPPASSSRGGSEGMAATVAGAAAGTGSVLVLHSYNVGYKWTDDISTGIMSVLGEGGSALSSGVDVDVQFEYMDTNRIYDDEYLALLLDTYRYKFAERNFDAIVVSDNNAFSFLLEHRDELFGETPVVFCGVNYLDPADLVGHAGFTGVNEAADVREGIELALGLHPDTQLVAIVNDTTTTGQRLHSELKAIEEEYKGRVTFVWFEAVDMVDLERALRVLPPQSIVFYTRFLVDKSGTFYEYDESIRRVVESSPVPVYGTWDFSLGYGIVGGMLTSGFEQGKAAAEMALRIVQGEPVDTIPVVMESPNRYMFDYTAVARWNIPLSALPQDAVVINRPLTFYERYRGWILGGGSVFIGLVLVIAGLVRTNVRRRHAEAALLVSNKELEGIRSTLEDRVARRTAALDRGRDQLEAAAQVAREAAAIRDVGTLLDEAARLITDRMKFYHVGIFLIDEAGRYAVLRAASSEGGQRMLAHGHRLPVGTRGIVGHAASSREPRIALDVGQDAVFFDNPDLPQTRSEIALPLVAYGEVLGVLDVQSVDREAFGQEDVAVLQTLADQLALAIDNARLLREAQDRLREITMLAGEQAQAGWREFVARAAADSGTMSLRYVYDGVDVVPVGEDGATVDAATVAVDAATVAVPLQVQDEEVGRLQVKLADRAASASEIELVRAVAARLSLALERARLFQEAQQRAASDRLVAEATARMRQTLSVDVVLKTAVQEIADALGLAALDLRLEVGPDGGNGDGEPVD